jgi:hypothetical protein
MTSTTALSINASTGTSFSTEPFPRGLGGEVSGRTNEFPLVGGPHRIRWIQPPPKQVDVGIGFEVIFEILDVSSVRVFKYDDATLIAPLVEGTDYPSVSLAMSNWNDPRCPVFCATLDDTSIIMTRSRGVVTMQNVKLELPTNAPLADRTVYRRTVQTVLLTRVRQVVDRRWRLGITATTIAENSGVDVTQAATTPGSQVQGKLRRVLTGAGMEFVVIDVADGVEFRAGVATTVGGTTITSENVLTSVSLDFFRLSLNLTSLDERLLGDYSTTEIAYDASAEEMKRRLQALPHVGRVDVSRSTRDQIISTSGADSRAEYTQWAITFSDLHDDFQPMLIRSNTGSADIAVREIVEPKHYQLEAVLASPLGYFPSRGFRLD